MEYQEHSCLKSQKQKKTVQTSILSDQNRETKQSKQKQSVRCWWINKQLNWRAFQARIQNLMNRSRYKLFEMNYFTPSGSFQINQVPVIWIGMESPQTVVPSESQTSEDPKYEKLLQQNQQLRELVKRLEKSRRRHQLKKRRPVQHLAKDFPCPYRQCNKEYASDLALNLHIRTKHNGGTKTEREGLAKRCIIAEQKGLPRPEITINFPPGYLQDFRNRYFKRA